LLCDAGALNEITDRIDFELFENRLNEILTEDEKNLYELRFKRELKAKEIAERLGITVSHCTVNISRQRKKIIKNLYDFRGGEKR
jgi:RNA polymerase sigma factor (sigma-70 family)